MGRPVNGFDQRPPANETTAASDLARIKYDRNELAHHSNGKIDDNSFITAWNNISEVGSTFRDSYRFYTIQKSNKLLWSASNFSILNY